MFANVIVALSNFYGFRAACQQNATQWDKFVLTNAICYSTLYHLAEKSKHNMTGFSIGGIDDKVWLNYDRFFAALAVIRFLFAYRHLINVKIGAFGIASLGFMAISECQHVVDMSQYPISISKPLYVITHVLWHIGAFHTAHLLLQAKNKD